MVTYIDEYKHRFGVEPIYRVLPIAPSTYYAHKAKHRDPDRRSDRVKRDDACGMRILACTVYAKSGASCNGKVSMSPAARWQD